MINQKITDKEKVFCVMLTKFTTSQLLYYSGIIGMGFVGGVAFLTSIVILIAKAIC
jgi:hypothetical protein